MSDNSIVPVRGQIGWLVPQPELSYGVQFAGVSMIPRRDGIVIQDIAGGDMRGYGLEAETPDREESERAVRTLGALFTHFGAPQTA